MNVLAADPFVLYDEIRKCYYCYATSGATSLKENKAFYIYKSYDKIHWEFVNFALDLNHENIWGKDWFWAPECYYNPINNHYYLFYSARVKKELTKKYFLSENYEESCKIGIAVSKSPEGPFVNISNEPLDYYPFDSNYMSINDVCNNPFELKDDSLLSKAPKGKYIPIIDVNLLFDNNKIYLYFSRCCYMNCLFDKKEGKFIEESNINAIELDTTWWFDKTASTMPKIKDEYIFIENGIRKDKFVELITYKKEPQQWENYHINDYLKYDGKMKNRRWSEGSTTFKLKIDGKDYYFLTYSCNHFMEQHYGVGIACATSPLGNYKKYELNPIIHQIDNYIYSTGHGSLVVENNELYYFIHGRINNDSDRILCYTKIDVQSLDCISSTDIKICELIKE